MGNEHAISHLLALSAAWTELYTREIQSLAQKQFSDLSADVRHLVVRTLQSAALASTKSLHSMSLDDMMKLLDAAKLQSERFEDSVSALVINQVHDLLAQQSASARKVVALSRCSSVVSAWQHSAEVKKIVHELKNKKLTQPDFDEQVKSALIWTGKKIGIESLQVGGTWQAMSTEKMANLISLRRLGLTGPGELTAASAASFAPGIASGDDEAARQLVATVRTFRPSRSELFVVLSATVEEMTGSVLAEAKSEVCGIIRKPTPSVDLAVVAGSVTLKVSISQGALQCAELEHMHKTGKFHALAGFRVVSVSMSPPSPPPKTSGSGTPQTQEPHKHIKPQKHIKFVPGDDRSIARGVLLRMLFGRCIVDSRDVSAVADLSAPALARMLLTKTSAADSEFELVRELAADTSSEANVQTARKLHVLAKRSLLHNAQKIREQLSNENLSNDELERRTKHACLSAAEARGLIHAQDLSAWSDVSSRDACKLFLSSEHDHWAFDMTHRNFVDAVKALSLEAESMQNILVYWDLLEKDQRTEEHCHKTSMNTLAPTAHGSASLWRKVKSALLVALDQLGIATAGKTFQEEKLSTKDAAELVMAANIDRHSLHDAFLVAAITLAPELARYNETAAKELLSYYSITSHVHEETAAPLSSAPTAHTPATPASAPGAVPTAGAPIHIRNLIIGRGNAIHIGAGGTEPGAPTPQSSTSSPSGTSVPTSVPKIGYTCDRTLPQMWQCLQEAEQKCAGITDTAACAAKLTQACGRVMMALTKDCSDEIQNVCPSDKIDVGLVRCLRRHRKQASATCKHVLACHGSQGHGMWRCWSEYHANCRQLSGDKYSTLTAQAMKDCISQRPQDVSSKCHNLPSILEVCAEDIQKSCVHVDNNNALSVVQCFQTHHAQFSQECRNVYDRLKDGYQQKVAHDLSRFVKGSIRAGKKLTHSDLTPEEMKEARSVYIRVLAPSGRINKRVVPATQLTEMNVTALASLLLQAGAQHMNVSDPLVHAAIELAPRIAKGNASSISELQARAEAIKTQNKAEFGVLTETSLMQNEGKTLADPKFNEHIKAIILHALRVGGLVSSDQSHLWQTRTAEQAADELSAAGFDAKAISDPVLHKTLLLARNISQGDSFSARTLDAVERASSEVTKKRDAVNAVLCNDFLHNADLKDKWMHVLVKAALLQSLAEAQVIKNSTDPRWSTMTTAEAAKLLGSLHLQTGHFNNSVVIESIKLCQGIEQGDVTSTRQLAKTIILEDLSSMESKNEISQARNQMLGASDTNSSKFRTELKSAMLKALVAAGIITDIHDPKWHSMSAEEAAKMLADADIDPSKISDPAVREAIKMAHRVAAGDVHAARHVAAHHVAASVVAHGTTERAHLSGAEVVPDAAFLKKSKILLVNALSAVGLAPRPLDSADWKDVTLRKASSRLASLGLRPESVQDPVIRKALRLAHAIAADDLQSAQRIIAHETSANSDAVHTLASKISTAVSVGTSSNK
jgi:hypothetical protein